MEMLSLGGEKLRFFWVFVELGFEKVACLEGEDTDPESEFVFFGGFDEVGVEKVGFLEW